MRIWNHQFDIIRALLPGFFTLDEPDQQQIIKEFAINHSILPVLFLVACSVLSFAVVGGPIHWFFPVMWLGHVVILEAILSLYLKHVAENKYPGGPPILHLRRIILLSITIGFLPVVCAFLIFPDLDALGKLAMSFLCILVLSNGRTTILPVVGTTRFLAGAFALITGLFVFEGWVLGLLALCFCLWLFSIFHGFSKAFTLRIDIIDLANKNRLQRQKLEESANIKDRFLASISHELRNPLQGLLGQIELARDNNLPPGLRNRLALIAEAGNGLLRLVEDLLVITNNTQNNHLPQLNKTVFDLEAFVEETVELSKQSYDGESHDIRLIQSNKLPLQVYTDRFRLRQILSNLLSNAVKFSNGKPVTLLVDHVYASWGKDEDNVKQLLFAVIDQGPGIPDQAKHQIFENFFQVKHAGFQNTGIGLGLSICKNLSKRLDAKLVLRDEDRKGARFELSFKLVDINPTAPHAAAEDTVLEGDPALKIPSNLSVLLIEDVILNQKVAKGYLQGLEVDLDIVSNGTDALLSWNQKHYDLILIDLNLPDISGKTIISRIKKDINPDQKLPAIVVVTADIYPGLKAEMSDIGIAHILTKPFSRQTLITVISKAIYDRETKPLSSSSTIKSSSSEIEPYIDIVFITEELEYLDQQDVAGMLDIYENGYLSLIEKAAMANSLGQPRSGYEHLHKLSSMSGNIGLSFVTRECRRLMRDLKSGQNVATSDIRALIDHVDHSLIKLKTLLNI